MVHVCYVYSLESPQWGDSNEYTQHTFAWLKRKTNPKISLNICFLELSDEFPRDSKTKFELAMVNESSGFESLRFYCNLTLLFVRHENIRAPRAIPHILQILAMTCLRSLWHLKSMRTLAQQQRNSDSLYYVFLLLSHVVLRKNTYSNILKILQPKKGKFSDKKIWYFSYFC